MKPTLRMVLVSLFAVFTGVAPAQGAWNPPGFGCSTLEGYTSYVGQSTCDPSAKPGVVAFRNQVLAGHPGTWDSGIVRACHIGGTSEHKEGRAWDWGVLVGNPAADDVLNKLLATDSCGQSHALARRIGLMYIIWNQQIWRAYKSGVGWQPYTGSNPHTDHVHFSFGWAGANAQTSYFGGSCTPGCDGSAIVSADCSQGDCAAFGATCVLQGGSPTCASQGCTPACNGTSFVEASCATGDCGAFGADCVMVGGAPKCVVSCTPHCDGPVTVAADCSEGDCSVFGATCELQGGQPTCVTACTPHCQDGSIVNADCSVVGCGTGTCQMNGSTPVCGSACTPKCQGSVAVAADCSTGDCGAFGANCVMEAGLPTCQTPCTAHCEGTKIVDAECGVGDCAAFGATCVPTASGPECQTGCKAHCQGTVMVGADCATGDCGAFGVDCLHLSDGVSCGTASCTPHCSGTQMVYSDCTTGDCGAFGLTCGQFDQGPECVVPACEPGCNGSVMVLADCATGDCGVFGSNCSMLTGTPSCVNAFCVDDPSQPPVEKDVCVGEERFHCSADGQLLDKPCPSGQSCNACAGCGPLVEVCDALDNDCDGQIDEGVKNACGGCGALPAEVCDFIDNDCNGQIDEGVTNACGGCGPLPLEICDFVDNNCDGQVDEGTLNACGFCGQVPAEVCDHTDNDCDGQVDEDFPLVGEPCTAGIGACLEPGALGCPEPGEDSVCSAEPGPPTDELCNGLDDDCDGEVDEDFDLGASCTLTILGCSATGTLACDGQGGAGCVATIDYCDDEDPCTIDQCVGDDCQHTLSLDCCDDDGDCKASQMCRDQTCKAIQCAVCQTDADCGAMGTCVGMGDTQRCALECVPGNTDASCPSTLQCADVGGATLCLPLEGEGCVCRPLPNPICSGDVLVESDACGQVLAIVEVCATSCADGACTTDGTGDETGSDTDGGGTTGADTGGNDTAGTDTDTDTDGGGTTGSDTGSDSDGGTDTSDEELAGLDAPGSEVSRGCASGSAPGSPSAAWFPLLILAILWLSAARRGARGGATLLVAVLALSAPDVAQACPCGSVPARMVLPADGATDVPLNTRIALAAFPIGTTGSMPAPSSVTLTLGGEPVAAAKTGYDSTHWWSVLLTPTALLVANTEYVITVNGGVLSTFTTGSHTDTTPPAGVEIESLANPHSDPCTPDTCGERSLLEVTLTPPDDSADADALVYGIRLLSALDGQTGSGSEASWRHPRPGLTFCEWA